METGTIYGLASLALTAIAALFAYIANRDKNKNEKADVVIGGYDKLYEDVRSELDRKIAQLEDLQEQYDKLTKQNTQLIGQNVELQKLGESLEKQIEKLVEEINILQMQLADKGGL